MPESRKVWLLFKGADIHGYARKDLCGVFDDPSKAEEYKKQHPLPVPHWASIESSVWYSRVEEWEIK